MKSASESPQATNEDKGMVHHSPPQVQEDQASQDSQTVLRTSGAAFSSPDDIDSNTISLEHKCEGADWSALFNPKVKRVLDVNLVHILVHESVVCCVRFSADGKYLATGCNRTAQIYDAKTGVKTW